MRYRKVSKQINNRVLYSILLSKEINITEFTNKSGSSRKNVHDWIFKGAIPSVKEMQQVTLYLHYPTYVLFNRTLVTRSPIICIVEPSHYYKRVISNSSTVNHILNGLLILYDLSVTDLARWTGIHPFTLRDYINGNIIPPYDYQVKLSIFFRIPVVILFYSSGVSTEAPSSV